MADQPRVETTSKEVRDYERPWTACAGSSSRSIARSKLRKRPKTSVGSRLETAAYWGNMAKGHFSSVELAGKMLPNRDSIASPPIVVGLDKAPKDFQFKVPLHPKSKSIPSEYAEYDLHGRKVIPKALHAEETLTTLSEEESAVFIPGENKKKVTAFFNSDYFALRRRGSGMIRASVIIPHQFIGNAGFVVGHHVVSVDAVIAVVISRRYLAIISVIRCFRFLICGYACAALVVVNSRRLCIHHICCVDLICPNLARCNHS